ncbi:hypothetical protein JTE90_009367 [Oedothorax gibbosus]|uniref:Schwannomin interacting protein 1 C-terminal domain-containing protein n=1 Tax=Oedothorax gibbosus TaxID=931172 RepID=A0AAV6VS63_9ARAC|nr:hypothetical protein JTE90_009367 [Oedothorax gibbosus]
MDLWKNKVGNAFQKFSTAGRDFITNIRQEFTTDIEKENDKPEFESLRFLRDDKYSDDVDFDPCLECDKEFGILTIEDEENDSFGYNHEGERRNDREEIRRKLAMDSDTEDYISEKLHQHREGSFGHLKSTGNLQICFMNEAAKDQDLSNAEDEVATKKNNAPVPKIQKPSIQLPSTTFTKCEKQTPGKPTNNNTVTKRQRPTSFFHRPRSWHASKVPLEPQFQVEEEEDLLTRHTRLQAEAREALAQAKDMARMQMEIERQKKKKSPIADIVGLPFPDGKNLLTYHALVAMNVAQLQVIVNDLHSQIETLNEDLVKFLLNRDDLHMEQDSMLVDIEDLTRYLGLKGSGGVSSSSSQVSVNSASESKMLPKAESVRRSQSVHLKSKHLM